MSISTIRRAFAEALNGQAACHGARMVNLDGGRQQRLEFDVQPNSGEKVTINETVPARTDLVSKAREMATTFISEQ
jgi:hypothetical protein